MVLLSEPAPTLERQMGLSFGQTLYNTILHVFTKQYHLPHTLSFSICEVTLKLVTLAIVNKIPHIPSPCTVSATLTDHLSLSSL